MLLLIVLPFFMSYVLRTVAWQLILADNGWVVSRLRDIGLLGAGGPAAGLAHGGDRRHHLQLPAVHGAAAVRLAGEDRPAADRGRDRPLRQPRDGVPRSRCRSRCRASSPARC